MWSVGMNLMW